MRILLPILFILIAGGIFLGFIDPTLAQVKELRAEQAKFDEALNRSKELQQVRDQLLSKYNTFPQGDVDRLEKLIPDNVDNVRLILDLDSTASRYGMRIRNVALLKDESRTQRGQVGISDENKYDSLIVSFSVSGSYASFLSFLTDLERSLRLVDVMSVSFTSNQSGIYDYSIALKTYWLKP